MIHLSNCLISIFYKPIVTYYISSLCVPYQQQKTMSIHDPFYFKCHHGRHYFQNIKQYNLCMPHNYIHVVIILLL